MLYAVRITNQDGHYYISEELQHEDRRTVEIWAATLLNTDPDVKEVEIVRHYTPDEIEKIRLDYKNAVDQYGHKETVQLVDKTLSSKIPVETKAGRLSEHPAFNLLSPHRKADIRINHDYRQMKFFCAQILSAVSVQLGLDPIGHRTSERVWFDVIAKCNAILYAPASMRAQLTRQEREARKAANRTERLARQPAKGVNSPAPKYGTGKKSKAKTS